MASVFFNRYATVAMIERAHDRMDQIEIDYKAADNSIITAYKAADTVINTRIDAANQDIVNLKAADTALDARVTVLESGAVPAEMTAADINTMINDKITKLMVFENPQGYLGTVDPSTFATVRQGDVWWAGGKAGDPIGTVWPDAMIYLDGTGWQSSPQIGNWTIADGDTAYWINTDGNGVVGQKYAMFVIDHWVYSDSVSPLD